MKKSLRNIVLPVSVLAIMAGSCSKDIEKGDELGEELTKKDSIDALYKDRWMWEVLSAAGIPPEIANEYDDRFVYYDIEEMYSHGILPYVANNYKESIRAQSIIHLFQREVSPELANQYEGIDRYENQFGRMVARFVENNVCPNVANRYNKKYHGENFTTEDIIGFQKYDISENDIDKFLNLNNEFGTKINGKDIVDYKARGLTYEDVKELAYQSWLSTSVTK